MELFKNIFSRTRYFKTIQNGYIIAIGIGNDGAEITLDEFEQIQNAIVSKPVKEGYDYRLKADLTWEEYEIPVIDPMNEEIDDAEAYRIIFGGDA